MNSKLTKALLCNMIATVGFSVADITNWNYNKNGSDWNFQYCDSSTDYQ